MLATSTDMDGVLTHHLNLANESGDSLFIYGQPAKGGFCMSVEEPGALEPPMEAVEIGKLLPPIGTMTLDAGQARKIAAVILEMAELMEAR